MDFADEFEEVEEALNIYISETYLKNLKIEFRDKWNYLKKLSFCLSVL